MFQKITRKHLEEFLKKYATAEKVLDIGSGGSSYNRYFPNRLTVDMDPDRKPEVLADAHCLPFKDGEFNFILCTEVLEHVKDPKKVIGEFNRVLAKGGTVILTTRFVYPIHDAPHDYWRFTEYGLRYLFNDWEIIDFQNETSTFETIAALLQRIIFQTKLKYNKLSKLIVFVLSYFFTLLPSLVMGEYGDVKRSSKVKNILSTGYYIVARKK